MLEHRWKSSCRGWNYFNLTTRQAIDYGFVDAQAETISKLLAQYQIVEVDERYRDDKDDAVLTALTEEGMINKQEERNVNRITPIKSLENAQITKFVVTLADRVVFFITSPYISAFLLSLGGLGLFVEIRTPGFGIPGFLVNVSSVILWWHMLNQISMMGPLILLVVSINALEVFLFPVLELLEYSD